MPVKSKKIVLPLVLLGIIAAVLLYFQLSKGKDLTPLIRQKLATLVNKASHGLYQLQTGEITINLGQRLLTIHDIHLTTDSTILQKLRQQKILPELLHNLYISKIEFKGLSPLLLLEKGKIHIDQLLLDSVHLEMKFTGKEQIKEQQQQDTTDLFQRLAQQGEGWYIGELLIQRGQLLVLHEQQPAKKTALQKLQAKFTDIRIDAATRNDSTRFLFASQAQISLKKYRSTTADNRYLFSIDSLSFKPQQHLLDIIGVKLEPNGSRKQFSSKLPYLLDRYHFSFDSITLWKPDWKSLLAGQALYMERFSIKGGWIEVFNDRSLPPYPYSKIGNYPHQLLQKINIPVLIPAARIEDIEVRYAEFNPASGKTGTLYFKKTEAQISGITNIKPAESGYKKMEVRAHTNLMGKGPLNARFIFDLQKTVSGDFSLAATLGPFNGVELSPPAEALGLFSIRALALHRLNINIIGNNHHANGSIGLHYNNLKVQLLRKGRDGKLHERSIVSALAHAFAIREKSKATPAAQILKQRDPKRSFFSLIWKTMLDGIKSLIA